jgi:HPt (histidine-containing phosphotransfer) domain-containing protein
MVEHVSTTFSSEDLIAAIGPDIARMRELRDIFEEEAPRVLDAVFDAVIRRDATALAHHAHLLKHVVGIVGGRACRDVAFRLEKLARARKMDTTPELAIRLGNELDALRAALAAFVGTPPAS